MQSTSKPLSRAVCLAAFLAASAGCLAQTPPMAAPVPPPPADAGAAATTQVTVARFLTNPDGDVDGFLTTDGALVHFPPHMGA